MLPLAALVPHSNSMGTMHSYKVSHIALDKDEAPPPSPLQAGQPMSTYENVTFSSQRLKKKKRNYMPVYKNVWKE